MIARKQRQVFAIEFHVFGVARHDHFHEIFGDAIAAFTFNKNFVNIAIVQIADRPFDQVALFINLGGGNGFQRQFTDLFPQTLQVFIIALDLGLGALGTCRTHNQARATRHFNLVGNLFELFPIRSIGDLAADAAATRGVGHQDAITACQ